MSYPTALEAAGATVLEFQRFGSYSGQWFAKVKYESEVGWIQGWYGSCGYCDSFEREFEYLDLEGETEEQYQARLANFGKIYLETILPASYYLTKLDEDSSWDSDATEAASWLRSIENI